MTTISDKFNRAFQSKEAIRQALISKGVEVSTDVPFADYAEKINNIESGSDNNPYQELYMQRTANETNMVGLFAYIPASTTLDLSMMNTSKVTNMSYMFSYCRVPYLDLSGFDVSNVTNMDYMFTQCSSEINIDGWDTSKLTNTNYMFNGFTNNNKYLDLSVLDFSNVTKTENMFNNCNVDYVDIRNINIDLTKLDWSAYNGPYLFYSIAGTILDLSNWTLDSSMTSLKKIFNWAKCKEINLTNWKTTNITNMQEMFYYNSSLERLIMPDWDITNTTNTSSFFYRCDKLNYIDLSRSNDATIAKIATLVPAQKLATYGQIIIPADSSQANIEALVAKYWKPVGPRLDLTSTELILELDEVKPGKSTKLYYSNSEPWYGNDVNVEYVSSDESVATVDKETMTITSTGVEGTTEITARITDTQEVISEPKVLSISETDNYPNVIKFRGTSMPASGNYIKVNDTDVKLSAMDYNNVSGIYTYDAGVPITSIQFNGPDSSSYANTCTDLVKINTSNVTDMDNMFNYCTNLTSLDVSNFDTSNVTTMYQMFDNCTNLTTLDVSSFDTSNVTNTAYMFNRCDLLEELDLSGWDTSSLTNMGAMFQNCSGLTELNLSNFDLTNATNIQSAFSGCTKLHTLRLDNCSNATISKIITSTGFPTYTISGVTKKIYVKEENAAGLTAPENWVFEYIS